MRRVLLSTETNGRPFVVRPGVVAVQAMFAAANRAARTWDVDIGLWVGGSSALGWDTVHNNLNANRQRSTNIACDTPYRVTGSAAGTTVRLGLAGGGDGDIFFGPYRTGAARVLDSDAGDVDVIAMKPDFRMETELLGGIRYTVATSAAARATATVDGDGNVTVTSVSSGVATITLTVRDRYGIAATNTVAVTVS